MLEFPETHNIADQLRIHTTGKIVSSVLPPTKINKFCWFNGDPADYNNLLTGMTVKSADGFGIYVELVFEGNKKLCFNDGINVRLFLKEAIPKNYQLVICFEDGYALVFTVAMYGGIYLHDGSYDNEYYIKSKNAISPFSEDFDEYFRKTLSESKQTMSVKAFLATEQRFPGIGNGVLQDILFCSNIHPKRKIATLEENEKDMLFKSIHSVLKNMTEHGGRDTEKDLFGKAGGYKTMMSKNSVSCCCPVCKGEITKEAYLGGSVYYCARCQRLE